MIWPMTSDEKIQQLEALAVHANEEGMPLSPLLVLAVCEGRFHVPEKPRPLCHDLITEDHPAPTGR